jgi:hypothetical protein
LRLTRLLLRHLAHHRRLGGRRADLHRLRLRLRRGGLANDLLLWDRRRLRPRLHNGLLLDRRGRLSAHHGLLLDLSRRLGAHHGLFDWCWPELLALDRWFDGGLRNRPRLHNLLPNGRLKLALLQYRLLGQRLRRTLLDGLGGLRLLAGR